MVFNILSKKIGVPGPKGSLYLVIKTGKDSQVVIYPSDIEFVESDHYDGSRTKLSFEVDYDHITNQEKDFLVDTIYHELCKIPSEGLNAIEISIRRVGYLNLSLKYLALINEISTSSRMTVEMVLRGYDG
jgi:hypothetical protein